MMPLLVDKVFAARPERLCEIRRTVAEAADAVGGSVEVIQDVVLAVDEACQNIIRHAYRGSDGDIQLQVEHLGGRLIVRLIDFAPPVDVEKICPRALEDVRPGGLGTHLMRQVMDEISFLPPPAGAGNMLQMVKRIGES